MRVHIVYQPWSGRLAFYFIENHHNGKIAVVRPMQWEMEVVPEGTEVEPSMVVPGPITDGFLKAMAEALDQRGVKTDSDAKLAGTIEATRYHLEDLRRLLKLPVEAKRG